MQKGCPDIIPGLRGKPWWYSFCNSGIHKIFHGWNISRKIIKKFEMRWLIYEIKKDFSLIEVHHGYPIERLVMELEI